MDSNHTSLVPSAARESSAAILVVDDEPGMREGCKRALSPLGHTLDTAADLASALRLIHSKPYDLCLLDVMLPDGSGLDLIAPILKRDPSAICIVITGFGSIEIAVEATKRGAYNFITKPFTSDELILAVNQGLERRRLKAIELQAEALAHAKEELEKLDRMKSQLMLKVAHEMRAPVAAVQSYINLILAGYVSEDEIKSILTRVQTRLRETLDLVADLMELARLKEAKDRFAAEASPQPAADILQGVCDLLQGQVQEKGQSFHVDISAQPTIVINREHLKQIWTNLISNAIKYTAQGGRIAITLQVDAERGKLISTVEDSGIGIAEKDMQYLFQEFFRTDQAKASGETGTGLGLSIVKQIVESYGGEIEVTSHPGQGSRFTVILPLTPPPVEPQEKPVEPPPTATARFPVRPTTHTRAFIVGGDSKS
jgi:two-component system sensor histidine kinase/response regulator